MQSVTDIVATIQEAEKIKSDETQRFPDAASAGDCCRQGDVYLMLLDKIPPGAQKVVTPVQLAPGNTQGSRHCLDSTEGVVAYQLKDGTEFDGPILKLNCERTITHPEHGDWILPAGIYAVGYQRTQDGLDRARRVQD